MYQVLIASLTSLGVAQIIKFFLKSNQMKLSWKNLSAYSGMPSGHTALTVSLSTIIGLQEGLDSPLFALSFILAIIIIRDAIGLRLYLGQHGKVLNKLVNDLDEDSLLDNKYPKLLEKIGHSHSQVVVGGIIGLLVSLFVYYI